MPRWTPESRAIHAERMRKICIERRIWEHSTGARTSEGKTRSAQNALKHGLYTSEQREQNSRIRQELRKALSQLRALGFKV